MFQFPRLPPMRYGLAHGYWVMKPSGLPHSDIPGYAGSRLTEAYRSVATSFIGSRRQGIHPVPVVVDTAAGETRASVCGPALGLHSRSSDGCAVTSQVPARRGQGWSTTIQPLLVLCKYLAAFTDVDKRMRLEMYRVIKGNKRGSNSVQALRTRYSAIPGNLFS